MKKRIVAFVVLFVFMLVLVPANAFAIEEAEEQTEEPEEEPEEEPVTEPVEEPVTVGWQKANGSWYYFDASGQKFTGWNKVSDRWYYFSETGIMERGWIKDEGKWYYLGWPNDPNFGAMRRGWIKDDDKWYYLGWPENSDSGAMAIGWRKIDDRWYYFGSNGSMMRGWQYIKGLWYYLGWPNDPNSGAMRSGWIKYKDTWYYLLPEEGAMATDMVVDKLYINADGVLTKAAELASEVLDEIGWDLKEAYAYCRDKKVVNLESPQDNGTAWCAEYLFTNDEGECVTKSAAFYYLAKTLGYKNIVHLYGSVYASGQDWAHAWCEMEEDGEVYIFDPCHDDYLHQGIESSDYTSTSFTSYYVPYKTSGTYKYNEGYTNVES